MIRPWRCGRSVRVTGLAFLVMTLLATAVAAVVGPAAPASAYPGAPWFQPGVAYTSNFPDPMVVRDGSTYYAYSTNTGGALLPVMSSTDLTTWTPRAAYNPGACNPANDPYFNDALPCPPSWAMRNPGDSSRTNTEIQAPSVAHIGSGWVAVYTVRVSATRHCISLATASSPIGPFSDQSSGALVCDSDPNGSIDPFIFVDDDSTPYLIWKSEGVPGSTPQRIWSQRMTADGHGLAPATTRTLLLQTALPWEGNVVENPAMIRWGGQLWLFYSGNEWQSANYAEGYASCPSPTSACTRQQGGPLLASLGSQLGPGAGSPFIDTSGRLRLAYHSWNAPYTSYPAYPQCLPSSCATQGQRRMSITGLTGNGSGLTAAPVGNFETATGTGGAVGVSGWAIDPDTASAATVVVIIDGASAGLLIAGGSRPDVGTSHPGFGANHGFSGSFAANDGSHQVCVTAYNIGASDGSNGTSLGCRTVVVQPPPPPVLPTGPLPPLVDDAGFHPVTPTRIMDTRDGTGGVQGPVRAGWTVPLDATGVGGVPASGVSAVSVNVTVVAPAGGGYVTVFPCGAERPVASNLNFVTGQTVANLAEARLGAGDSLCLYSTARLDLIVDVSGWYDTDGSGDGLASLSPSRVLDTRNGIGSPQTPLSAGVARTVAIAGHSGVPASGADAVVLNLTATNASGGGWLVAWPSDQTRPVASNLNMAAGDTVANLVVVPLSATGTISIYSSIGHVDVIGDVVGWFGPGASPHFGPVTPSRLVDTRNGIGAALGRIHANAVQTYTVTGAGDVPADATAVILNVTVTDPLSGGYLTIWPGDESPPVASSINWKVGQTVPNLVVAKVDAQGQIHVRSSFADTHVIIDVLGWYR